MKHTQVLAVAILAFSALSLNAQTPRPSGLQLQVDPAATPAFKGLPLTSHTDSEGKPADETPADKKAKGPTQIDALEATFDQKKNEAVFIGNVVVKDPEFNVTCDKLTALLKTAAEKAKEAPGVKGATPGPHPTPATPAATPTAPAGGTPAPTAKKEGGGGLRKAIAEAAPGNRVNIVQDKLQPDGTTQRSTGIADKATYDAVTGDVVLTGNPEVQQGINLVVSTASSTVMTLNRDGTMIAKGPHRTIITDKGDTKL